MSMESTTESTTESNESNAGALHAGALLALGEQEGGELGGSWESDQERAVSVALANAWEAAVQGNIAIVLQESTRADVLLRAAAWNTFIEVQVITRHK